MSYIFSLVAKSDMQNKFCVIFFERKIQGSASAGSYISLEEVILNKSITRRKANITAQQYHFEKYLALQGNFSNYHKSVHGFIQLPNPLQGLGFAVSFLRWGRIFTQGLNRRPRTANPSQTKVCRPLIKGQNTRLLRQS